MKRRISPEMKGVLWGVAYVVSMVLGLVYIVWKSGGFDGHTH